jgi:hypothetical protein
VRSCQRRGSRLAVEAGDDGDLVVVNSEIQRVRKAIEHQRSSNAVAPHDREAQRILGDAEHRAIEGVSKAAAKRDGALRVPILGLDDVVTGVGDEDNFQGQRRSRSARSASQFTPWARSLSSVSSRRSNSCCWAELSGRGSCSRLSQSWPIRSSRSSTKRRLSSSLESCMGHASAPFLGPTRPIMGTSTCL